MNQRRQTGGSGWRLLGASPLLLGAHWLQWWWGATGLAIGLLFPAAFVCARRRWLERALLVVGAPYLAYFGAVLCRIDATAYTLHRAASYVSQEQAQGAGLRIELHSRSGRLHISSEPLPRVFPGLSVAEAHSLDWELRLMTEREDVLRVRVSRADLYRLDGVVHWQLDLLPRDHWIPFKHRFQEPSGPERCATAVDRWHPRPLDSPELELRLDFELEQAGGVTTHRWRIPLVRRIERTSGVHGAASMHWRDR